MKKKKLIRQSVLAGLLAVTCQQAVWAAEGIDMPFSTVSALEAVGGIASIDSSNINHRDKGISVSNSDFIYNSGAVELDITGFTGAINNSSSNGILDIMVQSISSR
ncbi:MAG: hypothetical protein LUC29_11190 [Acidaminococcaceae bacterium]|nr:hypothetical protein [Acidaminococcaceae bacterium]